MLLSPSGINAVLTGHSYGATEEGIRELLEEWKMFFPQRFATSSSSNNLPAAVEVVVGMLMHDKILNLLSQNQLVHTSDFTRLIGPKNS